jgi:lysophospholipase L1-like esterase
MKLFRRVLAVPPAAAILILVPATAALAASPPRAAASLHATSSHTAIAPDAAPQAATTAQAAIEPHAAAPGLAAASGPPPGSMASLGDSISRGFNTCGWFVDCPARSYSTGTTTSVNSHYLRVRAVNPAIDGRNYNDSRSGAKAADMAGQAGSAVSQRVQYVTMLIGANDACTATEASMTSVSAFRSSVDAALARIKAGLPGARVFVISIPDLKRLWAVGSVDAGARNAWSLFGVCQSMLANPASKAPADEARRERVRQRVMDFNAQLAAACVVYGSGCRFDNNAVFACPFTLSHLSTWDYFHPNSAGQAILAAISYPAGSDGNSP